jgi:hypothetical protein
LQAALNPPGEHSVEKFGSAFSVGDKVTSTAVPTTVVLLMNDSGPSG